MLRVNWSTKYRQFHRFKSLWHVTISRTPKHRIPDLEIVKVTSSVQFKKLLQQGRRILSSQKYENPLELVKGGRSQNRPVPLNPIVKAFQAKLVNGTVKTICSSLGVESTTATVPRRTAQALSGQSIYLLSRPGCVHGRVKSRPLRLY